jgi:hypothetical protein
MSMPTIPKNAAMILALIGVILAIVGAAIIVIPGAPMRGSGIGTISVIAGVLLLIFGLYGLNMKRQ